MEDILDCRWEWMGEGDRAKSRKTKTSEETAKPVQVKADEPLVVGNGHEEELKLRDMQKVGETKLNNQLDSVVRENSQG